MTDKHTEAYLDGEKAAIAGDSISTNPYSLQRHSNSWKSGYRSGLQKRAEAAESRAAQAEAEHTNDVENLRHYLALVDTLEVRAAQAEADWRGLRDAVFGQENCPIENRAMVEVEANRLRQRAADLLETNRELSESVATLRAERNALAEQLKQSQTKIAELEAEYIDPLEESLRRMSGLNEVTA